MEANKILNADILDIIFEGRNKEYGAYELRKTYNRRITIAICIMIGVCLIAFLSSVIGSGKKETETKMYVQDVELEKIDKEEKKPEPPPPPPPPKIEPPPQVELTKFTPPKIVPDVEVKEPPPVTEEITNVAEKSQEGVKEELPAPPPEVSTGPVDAPKKDDQDYDALFTKVENPAKFPGGEAGWVKYLERSLNANTAQEDGAPPGRYTVKVEFIVDKQGKISNVKAIEVPSQCPNCGPEAEKVIRKGPPWNPAIQNGRAVNFKAVQGIVFEVRED